jgi:hypothetical protein
MITKALEIRDRHTFIPVIAVKMVPDHVFRYDETNQERYLLRRAGYGFDDSCVILCRMECSGTDRNATYDPYSWGGASRTMTVAHDYIQKNFDSLISGDVIDCEYILGETKQPKQSERIGHVPAPHQPD